MTRHALIVLHNILLGGLMKSRALLDGTPSQSYGVSRAIFSDLALWLQLCLINSVFSGHTGSHTVTQCYLIPDTSEHIPPIPAGRVGTRFIYARGMEG